MAMLTLVGDPHPGMKGESYPVEEVKMQVLWDTNMKAAVHYQFKFVSIS